MNTEVKPLRIFIDMDGVICDFDKAMQGKNLDSMDFKHLEGAYANLDPIEGAIDGVKKLYALEEQYHVEIWIATKPPTGNAKAYSEKAEWIYKNLPQLKRRIIITHNKGLLGKDTDFLIDDRPHKAGCREFSGTVIHYGESVKNWEEITSFFSILIKTTPVLYRK